jgi:hypothetical protein
MSNNHSLQFGHLFRSLRGDISAVIWWDENGLVEALTYVDGCWLPLSGTTVNGVVNSTIKDGINFTYNMPDIEQFYAAARSRLEFMIKRHRRNVRNSFQEAHCNINHYLWTKK